MRSRTSRNERAPIDGVEPGDGAKAIAASLLRGERRAILLGNAAIQHPQASQLHAWAHWIARATGAAFGVLTEAANTVGGHLVDAKPAGAGLNARQMIERPRSAYLLWNLEPDYDTANPAATAQALQAADTVIAFSNYRNGALDYADVILPITPFTETAGSFVSCEGRMQSFNGTVRPAGEARPGGRCCGCWATCWRSPVSSTKRRSRSGPTRCRWISLPACRTTPQPHRNAPATRADAAERIADVPIYFSDSIVRRSAPLQATRDALPPKARANARTLQSFGVHAGDTVRVSQGDTSALLEAALDERIADGVVHVSAAHESTATLGPMFGPITLERA